MDAFPLLVVMLLWGTGWAWLALHLVRRHFTEPETRFAGLPSRVWAGLILAWSWLPVFIVEVSVVLPLWPAFAVGPAGLLIVGLEAILKEWNRRSSV